MPRERVLPILAGVVVILALLVSHPFETVSALTLVYVIGIPVAVQRYMKRAAEEKTGEKAAIPVQSGPSA